MLKRRESFEHHEGESAGGHHPGIARKPLDYQPIEPLFSGGITTTEGLFSRDVRSRVERVFAIVDMESLSMPLVYTSRLIPSLFDNFPNAEIVSDTPVASLYKSPDGRSATLLDGKFTDVYRGFRDKRSRTVGLVAGPTLVDSPSWNDALDGACCLTLDFNSFGMMGSDSKSGYVYVLKDKRVMKFPKVTEGGYNLDEIERDQGLTLKHLGFEKLPEAGSRVTLTPDRYSSRLNREVEAVSRIVEAGAHGLPLVFVNPFKGMSGMCIRGQWVEPIPRLLESGDVAVAINEGPLGWKTRFDGIITKHVDELYSLLSDASHRENLLRLGSNDVTRLAAVLHLTRETGGCLVDIQTGTTHLADWMNTPEVVVRMEKRYIRPRKNLRVLGMYDFEEIPAAVGELVSRGKRQT